jgi:predicted ATPase
MALMGDQDGARTMIGTSVAEARSLGDPFSLALTLYFTSVAAQILGDVPRATENSMASKQLSTEHALEMPKAWSTCVAGWCAVASGDHDRGLAMLDESIAMMQATQSLHFFSFHAALLADARLRAGQHALAMTAVEEGLIRARDNGDRFYLAELHRLRGELLAHPSIGEAKNAEASFQIAISIAKQQGAVTLQDRAHKSLESLVSDVR